MKIQINGMTFHIYGLEDNFCCFNLAYIFLAFIGIFQMLWLPLEVKWLLECGNIVHLIFSGYILLESTHYLVVFYQIDVGIYFLYCSPFLLDITPKQILATRLYPMILLSQYSVSKIKMFLKFFQNTSLKFHP